MMMSSFDPNGLKPNEGSCAEMVVDQNKWSTAEARVSELIGFIKPSQISETRRNAVISYLQHLLITSVPCQVFAFGSVPLKTYLPDGDIDLTVFGDQQILHDTSICRIRNILRSQENSHNSLFQVRNVLYIQAEVTIIKCFVDNFAVDISFNQLSGLCALCFFEEISALISRDHLFKCSILLIKAWCYYESRILGSNHGLISTYALEILVLYIFNLYNNQFSGPLEVLYRFLDFFGKFDWDTYCISLRGPVPKASLPNMIAEPPRKDCQHLLLPELLLNNYEYRYGYMPFFQRIQEQSFVIYHMNIIDPLRANNNLGRSIGRGNFIRIKSAIAYGARQLEKLINCSEDNVLAEVDFIFKNTWNRHGNGRWVPVYFYNFYLRNKNFRNALCQESEVEEAQASSSSHGGSQGVVGHNPYEINSFGAIPVTIPNRRSLSARNMFCSQDFPILERKNKQKEIAEPKEYHSMKANSGSGSSSSSGKTAKTSASYAGALLKGTVTASSSSSSSSSVQNCNLPTDSDASHVNSICQDESFDILIGDYRSHWQNLQYGRFCQNEELNRRFFYPPTNAPPLAFPEQLPWNMTPPSSMNVVAPGAPLVPEMPRTLAPPSQEVTFWLPRFSDGTGSFMPNLPSNHHQGSSHRQEDQRPRGLNANSGESFSSSGQVHYRRDERPGTSKEWHQGECSVNELQKSKRGSR